MRYKLEQLRKAAGLERSELASESGVSYAMIYAIETGKRKPTLELAGKLTDALGVEIKDLIE